MLFVASLLDMCKHCGFRNLRKIGLIYNIICRDSSICLTTAALKDTLSNTHINTVGYTGNAYIKWSITGFLILIRNEITTTYGNL